MMVINQTPNGSSHKMDNWVIIIILLIGPHTQFWRELKVVRFRLVCCVSGLMGNYMVWFSIVGGGGCGVMISDERGVWVLH